LAPVKVTGELAYMKIAIDKTAGPDELTGWKWVINAIQDHPRHQATAVLEL